MSGRARVRQRRSGDAAPQAVAGQQAQAGEVTPLQAWSAASQGSSPGLLAGAALGPAIQRAIAASASSRVADPQHGALAPAVQTTLRVSQPGDAREQEAEALARRSASGTSAPASRADDAPATSTVPGGETLPAEARGYFEPRLGHHFGDVRVHADDASAASARALGARAYTVGHDLYFAAGQYAPTTREGQSLLAHELAHVAQHGGEPAAIHRAPDNQVITVPTVTITDDRPPQPTTLPEITIVGDPSRAPLAPGDEGIAIDPEALIYDVLHARVGDLINAAHSLYEGAIGRVQGEILAKGQADAESQAATMSLIASAGLMLIPGGAYVQSAARIAGIPSALRPHIGPLIFERGITGAAAEKALSAVDSAAPLLAQKVTAASLQAGFESAIGKVAAQKVPVEGANRYALTIAYLDTLGKVAHENVIQLLTADFTPSQLLGLYSTYTAPTLRDTYLADLRARADNFLVEVAGVKERAGKDEIVRIPAYGRLRYARVIRSTGSPILVESYPVFSAWITPDMEPIVAQSWPDARTLDPQKITGHIPDPVDESGKRIVEIDAWGHPRLAEVSGGDGKIEFGHWIKQDEEAAARARGSLQIGGINRLPGDRVSGMTRPTAAEEW